MSFNYWRNSYQPAAGRGGDGTPGDPHPTEPGALPLPLPVSRPSRPGRSFLSSSLETLQGPSGFLPRVWDAHQPGGRPCLSTQGGMTRDGAQNSRVRTLTHTRMHTHTFTHTLLTLIMISRDGCLLFVYKWKNTLSSLIKSFHYSTPSKVWDTEPWTQYQPIFSEGLTQFWTLQRKKQQRQKK